MTNRAQRRQQRQTSTDASSSPVAAIPPVKVQVAFQGGGAKLCRLLAAAEALQRLRHAGVIDVTRVAGTSAGAIAAALFAADADFVDLRVRARKHAKQLLRVLPVGRARALYRLMRGLPIAEERVITQLLEREFQKCEVQTFGDVVRKHGTRLVIMATDLRDLSSTVYEADKTKLASAVMDSCAIPYYFRTARGTQYNQSPFLVDGGICENFPVDALLPHEATDGMVLGISFVAESLPELPRGPGALAKRLLDAAMENSVRRAQRLLTPERLLLLPNDIGPLDFARALGDGINESYEQVRDLVQEFVSGAVSDVREQRDQAQVLVRIPEESLDSATTLQSHADLFAAQHAHVPLRYEAVRVVTRTRDWRVEPDEPDELRYWVQFHADEQPLACVHVNVIEEPGFRFLASSRTNIVDRHHNARATIDLRARDVRSHEKKRTYLHFFNPVIQPGDPDGPFQLHYRHKIEGLLSRLRREGTDTLWFVPRRARLPVPRVELVVLLPTSLAGARLLPSPRTTSADKGREMTPAELSAVESGTGLDLDLYALGWVGQDIGPGQDFAADLVLPSPPGAFIA